MENKTLRSVLWQKVIECVEDLTLGQFALRMGLGCVAILYVLCIASPAFATRLASWNNGTVPLSVFVCAVLFSLPKMWALFSEQVFNSYLPEQTGVEPVVQDSVEGIPVDELLEHLFTVRTFKRADIEQKFGIPRYKYSALATRLKEIGVLTHGENNATILADGIKREDVMNVLRGKGSAEELEKPLNIVRPLPSSPPIFTKRVVTRIA